MVDDCADVGERRRKRKRHERREINKARHIAGKGGRSRESFAGNECRSREREKNAT